MQDATNKCTRSGIEIVPPVVDVEEEKKKVNEEDRQVPWKPHERKPACLSGNELGIHGATYRNSIKEHYEEQNSGRRTITVSIQSSSSRIDPMYKD